MKVLHLGKYDTFGGIERHVRMLLQGLQATGRVVPVNLVLNDGPHDDEHHDYGYRTVRVATHGQLASVGLAPSLPFVARRLQAQYGFDIVHLHFPDPLGQLTCSLLRRPIGRVVSWHSDVVRQKFALALYRPFQRRFVAGLDAVIGATPMHFGASDQIPPEFPDERRYVIPYGFDPERWRLGPAAIARLEALRAEAAGRVTVFTLGRHVYYKGFDVLIRAMRAIDGLLLIGGDGPERANYEQVARAELPASRVRFTGPIPEAELPAYYEACSVFCLPSVERSEAFGLVQLEAMYFRRPVVSTLLGTGVDWVNQHEVTGLLVPPGDTAALAEALRRLAADAALRERLGAAGRSRVESDFSVAHMVDRTLAVYERVVASMPT